MSSKKTKQLSPTLYFGINFSNFSSFPSWDEAEKNSIAFALFADLRISANKAEKILWNSELVEKIRLLSGFQVDSFYDPANDYDLMISLIEEDEEASAYSEEEDDDDDDFFRFLTTPKKPANINHPVGIKDSAKQEIKTHHFKVKLLQWQICFDFPLLDELTLVAEKHNLDLSKWLNLACESLVHVKYYREFFLLSTYQNFLNLYQCYLTTKNMDLLLDLIKEKNT